MAAANHDTTIMEPLISRKDSDGTPHRRLSSAEQDEEQQKHQKSTIAADDSSSSSTYKSATSTLTTWYYNNRHSVLNSSPRNKRLALCYAVCLMALLPAVVNVVNKNNNGHWASSSSSSQVSSSSSLLEVSSDGNNINTGSQESTAITNEEEESTAVQTSSFIESIQEKLGLIPPLSTDPTCDNILLYLPDMKASFDSQLSNYILAVMMASYMDGPLVVLDNPMTQGCSGKSTGLSNLVKIPESVTRNCPVPCQYSYDYTSWSQVISSSNGSSIQCKNDNRRLSNVFAVDATTIQDMYESKFKEMMKQRPYDWALRLGATSEQATTFSQLNGKIDTTWKYLAGLVMQSNIVEFQPLVLQDVYKHIQNLGLQFTELYKEPYDAMLIRRGDDILDDPDSRKSIANYWDSRGLYNRQDESAIRSYIPLMQYTRHYNSKGCGDKPRKVFIIANDKTQVDKTIMKSLRSNTLIRRDNLSSIESEVHEYQQKCYKLDFTVVHNQYAEDDDKDMNCDYWYERSISSIANLLILSKSETFVSDFRSSFGRLIRMMRTTLTTAAEVEEGTTSVLEQNVQLAWGKNEYGPPGW